MTLVWSESFFFFFFFGGGGVEMSYFLSQNGDTILDSIVYVSW